MTLGLFVHLLVCLLKRMSQGRGNYRAMNKLGKSNESSLVGPLGNEVYPLPVLFRILPHSQVEGAQKTMTFTEHHPPTPPTTELGGTVAVALMQRVLYQVSAPLVPKGLGGYPKPTP